MVGFHGIGKTSFQHAHNVLSGASSLSYRHTTTWQRDGSIFRKLFTQLLEATLFLGFLLSLTFPVRMGAQTPLSLVYDWRMGEKFATWHGSPIFFLVSGDSLSHLTKAFLVDSVGAQILVLDSPALQYKTNRGDQTYLLFAIAPDDVAKLPPGWYRWAIELFSDDGKLYRTNLISVQIAAEISDSSEIWTERWRILHWLFVQGKRKEAKAVFDYLRDRAPNSLLKQLTLAYFNREATSIDTTHSVSKRFFIEFQHLRQSVQRDD